MADKWLREFTPEEREAIYQEARQRNAGKARLHHWYNDKGNSQHLLQINALAIAGEVFVEEMLPGAVRNADISMSGDDGIDVWWRGYGIDVKTITWMAGGHLYWELKHVPTGKKKKPPRADLFILARVAKKEYSKNKCIRLSGWITVDEFWKMGQDKLWEKSQCLVHQVHSSELWRMETILRLPPKGVKQEDFFEEETMQPEH